MKTNTLTPTKGKKKKIQKKGLQPFNAVIQVCPKCRKIDVSKNDGHTCDYEYEMMRRMNDEYYD